jgi:hypothetical protein
MLKIVPKKSLNRDERRQFFIENANTEKYYYMAHPHRNTLVPLGTFLGFVNYNRKQLQIHNSEYFNNNNFSYVMRFSNPPYNAENGFGAIGMYEDVLLYTDEPPAAGSVPLSYSDYINQYYPGTIGGSIRKKRGKTLKNKKIKNKSKRKRKYV